MVKYVVSSVVMTDGFFTTSNVHGIFSDYLTSRKFLSDIVLRHTRHFHVGSRVRDLISDTLVNVVLEIPERKLYIVFTLRKFVEDE